MTTKKPFSAEFLDELEGDAVVFAAAPRLMRRRPVAGNQTVALATVRSAVLEALLATGYDTGLAEKMANEIADQVPVIELKLNSAA